MNIFSALKYRDILYKSCFSCCFYKSTHQLSHRAPLNYSLSQKWDCYHIYFQDEILKAFKLFDDDQTGKISFKVSIFSVPKLILITILLTLFSRRPARMKVCSECWNHDILAFRSSFYNHAKNREYSFFKRCFGCFQPWWTKESCLITYMWLHETLC